MAKINIYIPEPQDPYTVDNFRQINQTLETLQNQLNTSYLNEIKNEQVICSEYDNRQIKHEKKYFININNICYIEETISNYINDEKSI